MARIAYDTLQAKQSPALDKANTLLRIYSDAKPSMTSKEDNYPFVECATFADDIISKGGNW